MENTAKTCKTCKWWQLDEHIQIEICQLISGDREKFPPRQETTLADIWQEAMGDTALATTENFGCILWEKI